MRLRLPNASIMSMSTNHQKKETHIMPTKITASIALVAAAALALSGCASGEEAEDYNDADVEYAVGMILHHEQAIEMADVVLAKPDLAPEVADLAENIKAAQGPEIEQMGDWLDEWGHEPDDEGGHSHGDHGDHAEQGHEGMMSEEELAELAAVDGPQASRLFPEQMIAHHEGAVVMAERHLEEGRNPDALELSQNVAADQNAEIALMREMLADL